MSVLFSIIFDKFKEIEFNLVSWDIAWVIDNCEVLTLYGCKMVAHAKSMFKDLIFSLTTLILENMWLNS